MAQDGSPELRDQSIGELVKQLSRESTELVRKELELARAELQEKGRKAGAGAGFLGGAGIAALLTLGTLTACIVLALSEVMEPWLAALIVTAVYAAVAGVLAVTGKGRIQEATPPAPQTVETLKEDVQWAKNRTPSATR